MADGGGTAELDDLRGVVALLEARRDELRARLAAERAAQQEADEDSAAVEPAPAAPEPLCWRPRNYWAVLVVCVLAAVLGVSFDELIPRAFAVCFALVGVSQLLWPPRLSLDEHGIHVRAFITVHEHPWRQRNSSIDARLDDAGVKLDGRDLDQLVLWHDVERLRLQAQIGSAEAGRRARTCYLALRRNGVWSEHRLTGVSASTQAGITRWADWVLGV